MASFSTLPAELLPNICRYLEPQALKQLRLTCRGCDDPARKQLFHEITLYAHVGSLARAQNVANDSQLRNMVRKLTYSGKMVRYRPQFVEDFYEWRDDCLGSGIGISKDARRQLIMQITKGQLRQYHQNYVHFVNAQGEFLQAYSDELELRFLIVRFKKLVHVEFDAGFGDSEPQSINGLLELSSLSAVAQETLVERRQAHIFTPSYWGGFKRHARQFLALLRATGASKTVQTLHQYGVDYKDFDGNEITSWINPSEASVPRQLREIVLDFKVPRSYSTQDTDYLSHYDNLIDRVLAYSETLQSLSIAPLGHPRDSKYPRWLGLSAKNLGVFFQQKAYFPRLRYLNLCGFSVGEMHFRDMLKSHSETLRELRIGDMILFGRDGLPGDDDLKKYYDGEDISASEPQGWVSMLCFMHNSLSLTSLGLSGILVDGLPERPVDGEGHHIQECLDLTEEVYRPRRFFSTTHSTIRPDRHTLTASDASFVTHQGPCPFRPRMNAGQQDGWEYLHQGLNKWLKLSCKRTKSPDVACPYAQRLFAREYFERLYEDASGDDESGYEAGHNGVDH